MKLENYIKSAIGKICDLNENNIFPKAKMKSDLMISSLAYVKLITIIEDDFGVELPDDILVVEDDISVEAFCNKIEKILMEKEISEFS